MPSVQHRPAAPAEPVLAAGEWPTNAHLIEDVARLYLSRSDVILDPTYGRGVWWKRWQPDTLVWHKDTIDFRLMPYRTGAFDAVAFDPPYVCVGGRTTTGIPDMHDRFGLTDAPKRPAEVQDDINHGLAECARVVKPGGIVLVKCQDYIWSGRVQMGTHWTLTAALRLGLELVDRLEHVTKIRPQPPGRRQVHARRNLSTLFVFRRPAACGGDR